VELVCKCFPDFTYFIHEGKNSEHKYFYSKDFARESAGTIGETYLAAYTAADCEA
jgi:hypothetical protein